MARIIFLSNTPTPYQIDFFDEISKRHDVKTFFLWGQTAPFSDFYKGRSWVRILNYKKSIREHQVCWKKLVGELLLDPPEKIIIGGYRLPLSRELISWANSKNINCYFWMEPLLPSSAPIQVLKKGLVAWRARKVDGIIAIGKTALEQYRWAAKKSVNIPYSIRVDKYQSSQKTGLKGVRCLFVGQFIDRKGVSELLEAFSQLSGSEVSLTLAGYGALESKIFDYTQRFPHIKLAGFCNPEEINKLFGTHDIFILPSKHDGWGVVITEAMAAGLPVISTQHASAFKDYIRSEVSGIECSVDSDSIKNAVSYYLNNPSEITAHGERNKSILESSCSNSVVAAQELERFLEL